MGCESYPVHTGTRGIEAAEWAYRYQHLHRGVSQDPAYRAWELGIGAHRSRTDLFGHLLSLTGR